MMNRYVELRVAQAGEEILIYTFKSVSEAIDMLQFLDGMIVDPAFTVQPLRH